MPAMAIPVSWIGQPARHAGFRWSRRRGLSAGGRHPPQLALGKGNTLTVAAEDPKAELAGASEERAAVNRLPDVTVTARMERDWGHLQLGAVAQPGIYDGDNERDRRMLAACS